MDKKEITCLKELLLLEDLADKKAKIYSRLLMDVEKAKKMEALSARHEERKKEIENVLYANVEKQETKGAGTR